MTQFLLKKNKKKKINKFYSCDFSLIDINKVRKFRNENLYVSMDAKLGIYEDDEKSTTEHYGLFLNDKLISALTLIENNFLDFINSKSLQIRGMSTSKIFQKRGFGSILLSKIIKNLKSNKKYEILWCNSRLESVDFYKNNCFTPIGNIFNIKMIGKHQKLYLNLKDGKKL